MVIFIVTKMPKVSGWVPLFLLLAAVANIKQRQVPVAADTFVTEVIVPFDMPVDDLKTVTKNQLSRNDFKTSQFRANNVSVSKLVYKTTYNGTEKRVSPEGDSSKHTVTQDSIDIVVTYQAVIAHLPQPKKTVNGTTALKMYLNFTKEIDTSSGVTQFQNIAAFIDPKSFRMNYSGNPSESEKKSLESINLGNSSGSSILYYLKAQQFTTSLITAYFIENLVQQKISPTYNSTYLYSYPGINATFDMRTFKVQDISQGIEHTMKGSINGFNTPNQQVNHLVRTNGDFHTLFTIGFIKNFISYNIQRNSNWKKTIFERGLIRRSDFGYRLIDLEYILSGFVDKYRQNYLNDIRFECSALNFSSLGIDEVSDKLNIQMLWPCKGYLMGVNPNPVILDFDTRITYLMGFQISAGSLEVQIQKTFLQRLDFREVDGLKVDNIKLARVYVTEILSSIFGYIVGTNFKVRQGSSKIALKENEGLWIG